MWSFDVSQPYRPPFPVTGIALLYFYNYVFEVSLSYK
jgi:hypothetical protein